jgi:glycosyltransferase involved in cell wall biosynthesis
MSKQINIALVNTSEFNGGAAIACKRLFESLKKNDFKVKLFVQDKISDDEDVININSSKTSRYKNLIFLGIEKLHFYFFEKSKHIRFVFSTGLIGKSFYRSANFNQNEIIHLHWFNQGMLSLRGLKNLSDKRKIVWTLHDMWAFTGGCHYNADCYNFQQECGNCKYLKNPHSNDISKKQYLRKLQIYNNQNITFVTCSKWLEEVAKSSSLLKNASVFNIPNPINTSVYKPEDKKNARKIFKIPDNKFVILFGAASLKDTRKGLDYFIESLKILKDLNQIPYNRIVIALFGKSNPELENSVPFETHNLGYLSEIKDIVNMYSAADVYVTTALQDNLPNTVMEALACALPVVAFNIGGIPEMVENKVNGYLADFKSSKEIAEGIKWIYNSDYVTISQNARKKVLENFDEKIIAEKYQNLYLSLL